MYKVFLLIVFSLALMQLKGQSKYAVVSEQVYDAGALYGYMNGGSELYHEYNFISLTVQSIKSGNEELKFEIYKMKDPDMAFGIYSVNTYKCKDNADLDLNYVCSSSYQLQVAVGPYYLSLINTTGSEEVQSISGEIVQAFVNSHESLSHYELPNWYNGLNADNILLMNGRLGFENRASACSDFYNTLNVKQCYVAKWKKYKATLLIALMSDSENDEKKVFLPVEEKYQWSVKKKGAYSFFLRTPLNSSIAKELLDKI